MIAAAERVVSREYDRQSLLWSRPDREGIAPFVVAANAEASGRWQDVHREITVATGISAQREGWGLFPESDGRCMGRTFSDFRHLPSYLRPLVRRI